MLNYNIVGTLVIVGKHCWDQGLKISESTLEALKQGLSQSPNFAKETQNRDFIIFPRKNITKPFLFQLSSKLMGGVKAATFSTIFDITYYLIMHHYFEKYISSRVFVGTFFLQVLSYCQEKEKVPTIH